MEDKFSSVEGELTGKTSKMLGKTREGLSRGSRQLYAKHHQRRKLEKENSRHKTALKVNSIVFFRMRREKTSGKRNE
jgi:hypothetical protein